MDEERVVLYARTFASQTGVVGEQGSRTDGHNRGCDPTVGPGVLTARSATSRIVAALSCRCAVCLL